MQRTKFYAIFDGKVHIYQAMPKMRHFIPKTLSTRIILKTVFAIALLLIPAILAIIIGTRIITGEEVEREIDQALDGIAYRIDNTFLSVEQTAPMLLADIPDNLDKPQELYNLCRKVLEANPSIHGCAIALNPEYYTLRGKPFMAYMYRAHEEIVSSETFTSLPFTEQEWYRKPLREGVASWVGPLKNEDTETEPILSYDVPIITDNSTVGVLGIDVSLSVLTEMAHNYRTSTNSYITLLDRNGSYIVHPDSTRLRHMDSLAQLKDAEDPSVMEALQEMVEGSSGRRTFTLDTTQYVMAYMPFRQSAYPGRQVSDFGWSIALIYPVYELYEEFDPGFRMAVIMTLIGLLLLFAGAFAIQQISLKPLKNLVDVTQIISKGNYAPSGFQTSREDEVGRLQNQYDKMQHSVADYMEQLQKLSQKEAAHQEALAQTYAKTKEIQRHKAKFFDNMTHQMADVTTEIRNDVDKLCESGAEMGEEETKRVLENIEKNGQKVTEILSDLLNAKS